MKKEQPRKTDDSSNGGNEEGHPSENLPISKHKSASGFWTRVKKDLQLAMQEGADLLKEGTSNFTDKTRRFAKHGTASVKAEAGRVAKMGQLRYEHYRLNQKAQKKFSEIGGRVYELASKTNQSLQLDEPTKGLISEIKEIEDHIKKVEKEIQTISRKK